MQKVKLDIKFKIKKCIVGLIILMLFNFVPTYANAQNITALFGNWLGPLMKSTEQLTVSKEEATKQDSTTADGELAKDTIITGQEALQRAQEELQTDEVACEITSLGSVDAAAQAQNTKDNAQNVSREVSDNVSGLNGSLGGLLPGEYARIVADRLGQRCTPDENNGNFREVCEAGEAMDTKCHISPDTFTGQNIDPECFSEYANILVRRIPQIPPALANQQEIERTISTTMDSLDKHKATIAKGIGELASKGMPGPEGSNEQVRALLEEIGATDEMIAEYIPEGRMMSEDARQDVLINFYLANPDFFTKLQIPEANLQRIRVMLAGLHLDIDRKILEMQKLRTRHMSAIVGIDVNERRRGFESELVNASSNQQ